MKKISILGEEVSIRFNMAVEIAYEKICKKHFNLKDLEDLNNMLALYYASIVANNHDTSITYEMILEEANGHEIAQLSEAVSSELKEWLKVPEVMEQEPEQADGDDRPKN